MKHTHTLDFLIIICAFACMVNAKVPKESTKDYIEVGGNGSEENVESVTSPTTATTQVVAEATTANTTIGYQHHRIVGGYRTSIYDVPYQVAVIAARTFTCGGSLISTTWVLTAAHCVQDRSTRYTVRAGSDYFKRGGQARRVVLVARHGFYNRATSDNDIAMLKVNRPFILSSNVRTVSLPRSYSRRPSSYRISGWGYVGENSENPTVRLRTVGVKNVRRRTCARLYNDSNVITKNMICAAARGRDSCQGDSGGALVSDGVQYGIVSFGNGCARRNYPGVYTNLPNYRSWIYTVMRTTK